MKNKAWLVTMVVYLAGVSATMEQNKVAPTMDLLFKQLNVGVAIGGLLVSVFVLSGIVLAIPAGGLLAKLGPKRAGLLALGCQLLGNIIGAVSPNAQVLLISRIIEGIGFAMIGVIGPAVIAEWFPPEKRGLPMGIWSTWVGVGAALIFNAASGITPTYGWQGVWWLMVVIGAVVLVLYAFVVSTPSQAKADTGDMPDPGVPLGQAFKSTTSWLLSIVFAAFAFGVGTFMGFIPTYLAQALSIPTPQANFYASLSSLAMIVGCLLVGVILGRARNRELVLIICEILTALTMLVAFRLPSAAVVLPFMIIGGILLGLVPPVVFTLAPESAASPQLAGMALAIAILGQNVGGFAGAAITGVIVERTGAWASATIPSVIALVIGIVACIALLSIKKAPVSRNVNM